MKKMSWLVLLLAMALSFCGCSKAPADPAAPASPSATQEPADGPDSDTDTSSGSREPETEEPEESGEANEADETNASDRAGATEEDRALAKLGHAYAEVLSGILYGSVLPDGATLDVMDYSDMDSNQFAIADVDQDGQKELVLCFTNAPMSGMIAYIWEYSPETGELMEEFFGFPSLDFYSNGLLMEEASHNHSLNTDFWPYFLYQYEETGNSYRLICDASSWQKEFYPKDYEGNPFPDDVDTDGNGIVYLITDNLADTVRTYDDSDFEAWRGETFGSATPMELPWEGLTYEAIAAHAHPYLTYVKADIQKASSDKDLALLYMEGGLDAVQDYLSGSCHITFTAEDEYEEFFTGTLDSQEVFSLEYLDATNFTYKTPIGGVTALGLAPGMDAKEAAAKLEALGFTPEEGNPTHYVTGVGMDNYGIYLEVEDGKVTSMTFGLYCRYVG